MRFSKSIFVLGALLLDAFAVPVQQGEGLRAVAASLSRGISTSRIAVIPNDKRGVVTSKTDVVPTDARDVAVDILPRARVRSGRTRTKPNSKPKPKKIPKKKTTKAKQRPTKSKSKSTKTKSKTPVKPEASQKPWEQPVPSEA